MKTRIVMFFLFKISIILLLNLELSITMVLSESLINEFSVSIKRMIVCRTRRMGRTRRTAVLHSLISKIPRPQVSIMNKSKIILILLFATICLGISGLFGIIFITAILEQNEGQRISEPKHSIEKTGNGFELLWEIPNIYTISPFHAGEIDQI